MKALQFESVGTWVQYDALRGIIDNSSSWAVALDGDRIHEWVIVALEMTHDHATGTQHWLVLETVQGDDVGLYVIPLDEINTITF